MVVVVVGGGRGRGRAEEEEGGREEGREVGGRTSAIGSAALINVLVVLVLGKVRAECVGVLLLLLPPLLLLLLLLLLAGWRAVREFSISAGSSSSCTCASAAPPSSPTTPSTPPTSTTAASRATASCSLWVNLPKNASLKEPVVMHCPNQKPKLQPNCLPTVMEITATGHV